MRADNDRDRSYLIQRNCGRYGRENVAKALNKVNEVLRTKVEIDI